MSKRKLIGLLIAMSMGLILNPDGGRQGAAAGYPTPGTKAITDAGDPLSPGTVPRFAYVANSGDNTISIYTVNAVTGDLRSRGYVFAKLDPVSVSIANETIATRFVYAANAGSNNVSAYQINPSTGALASVPGSPFAAGTTPASVAIDPTGQFAYVANSGDDDVSAYTVNVTTGALTTITGSPFLAGISPASVTVDPTGRFVYVANSGGNDVSAYTINAITGALTSIKGSPFSLRRFSSSCDRQSFGQVRLRGRSKR